jgi:predicted nucleic acid-binding protein
MTVLLDTSVLIDLLRNRMGRREFFNDLTNNGVELASCAVTIAELYAGMRPSEAKLTAELLSGFEYFETTSATARLGGSIKAAWARKGQTLSLTDTLIAAVAIENGLSVATDNVKDFPMPELQLLPLPSSH